MVIPAEIRAELRAHAEEEAPNEACGLVVTRDGIAEQYVRGRNAAESPYRFELEVPPETWFLEDEGLRARRLPLPPLLAATPVAHGRREHRSLAGEALSDPVPRHRLARRLDDQRRPDRAARRRGLNTVVLRRSSSCGRASGGGRRRIPNGRRKRTGGGWQPRGLSHALVEEDALVLIDPLRSARTTRSGSGTPSTATSSASGRRQILLTASLARAQLADDPRPLSGCARLGTGQRGRRASVSSSRTRSRQRTRCREGRGEGDRLHDRGAALDCIPRRARGRRRPARHGRGGFASSGGRRGSIARAYPRQLRCRHSSTCPSSSILLAHGEPVRENGRAALGSGAQSVTVSPASADR